MGQRLESLLLRWVTGEAGEGVVALCTRRAEGRHGVMDAAPESFADAWVVGALGQLLDGKRETHIRPLRGGSEGEPIVQVHDILIPVPIPIGDVVTPATHLLDASLAPLEPLCHVSLLCHAPS